MKHFPMITVTQRMLDKSIIDVNLSITKFMSEKLPFSYDTMKVDEKIKCHGEILVPRTAQDDVDVEMTPETLVGVGTVITFYRRPRGDKLMSIKGLNKIAKAGDILRMGLANDIPDICKKISEPDLPFIRLMLVKYTPELEIQGKV